MSMQIEDGFDTYATIDKTGLLLTIKDRGGDDMVIIHNNGTVTFGPSYSPEAAAEIFWFNIATWGPFGSGLRVQIKLALEEVLKRRADASPSTTR